MELFSQKNCYAMVDMPILPWEIYINYIKEVYVCVCAILSLCIKLPTRVSALYSIGCWCLAHVLPGPTSKFVSSSVFVLRKG